jgi:uncharacterized membrane protein YkoI
MLAQHLLPRSGKAMEERRMKSKLAVLTLVAVFGIGTAVVHAADTKKETKKTEDQAALQKEAKISKEKAQEIALKKVPGGKVESSELEREHGKLIYSFDIKTSKPGVTEVNVDAIDGKVLAVEHESAKKEAEEKKKEAKEKDTTKH